MRQRACARVNTNSITSRIVDSTIMKRALLCLVVTFCAVSFAHGDPTIRSLQQTLKRQGFYYGAVTGEKNTETTAAIRRYQIRNGLQVTGELNDETLRSVRASSNSVAAESRPDSKPAVSQPSSGGPDVNARQSKLAGAVIQRTKSAFGNQSVICGELLSISTDSCEPADYRRSAVPIDEPGILSRACRWQPRTSDCFCRTSVSIDRWAYGDWASGHGDARSAWFIRCRVRVFGATFGWL